MSAAAGRIEPEDVSLPQRVIGVAGRQAFGLRRVRVDPDLAGTPAAAARAAARRNHMLHRTDRETRIGEVEIFAADAEPTAELACAAGVRDQLEADEASRKLALDDLHRRDLGVALIDRDAGRPILAGARSGAAGDDLVLHITLA